MKLTLRHVIAAIILVLSFAAPAAAGPLEDAGNAYLRGDYTTAHRLLRPLANQGNDFAQYTLGYMYANGEGVPQNYAEAAKWYRLAADQGSFGGQYEVGLMYAEGHGVPQNYAEAAKWYRLAADQDVPIAQYKFGLMYANGQGVLQDYVRAHMWLNLSAAHGAWMADEAITKRDEVARHMTTAQIAEAQKLAREWKPNIRCAKGESIMGVCEK